MIDTRPWIMRKALGEIPNCECVSFFDLFDKDPATGVKIFKKPHEL